MSEEWTTVAITEDARETLRNECVPGYPMGRQLSALIVRWYEPDRQRRDLLPKEVRAIKRLKEVDVSQSLIADAFDVSYGAVNQVEEVHIETLGVDDADR